MTAHEAGRELDALIAEKVFGAAVNRTERGPWNLLTKDGTPEHIGPQPSPWYYGAVPEFSTDIAAAFVALDAIGGSIEIRRRASEWFVCVDGAWHWATTLPLAICVAILAATDSLAGASVPAVDTSRSYPDGAVDVTERTP